VVCTGLHYASVGFLVLHTACFKITKQHLKKMVEEGRVRQGEKNGFLWGGASKYFPSAEEMAEVGNGESCSPRHRLPSDLRTEDSECV